MERSEAIYGPAFNTHVTFSPAHEISPLYSSNLIGKIDCLKDPAGRVEKMKNRGSPVDSDQNHIKRKFTCPHYQYTDCCLHPTAQANPTESIPDEETTVVSSPETEAINPSDTPTETEAPANTADPRPHPRPAPQSRRLAGMARRPNHIR